MKKQDLVFTLAALALCAEPVFSQEDGTAYRAGYDLILETSAGAVVYWGNTLDITQDLIARYNAKNPSTAGSLLRRTKYAVPRQT